MKLGAIALCALAVTPLPADAAETSPPASAASVIVAPILLMRDVRALEDRMAQGDQKAFHQRLELVRGASTALRSMPEEVWAESRNWRALLAYILGGGDTRFIKELATKGALKSISPSLLKGIVALAEAREEDALKELAAIKIQELDIGIAAPLALALAPRWAPKDVHQAVAMLEDVILRAPGTLMEESALRRLALVHLAHGDMEQALAAFTKHARRFPNSIFGEQASKGFAAEIASRDDQGPTWTAVLAGTHFVAPDALTRFYLDIAEGALRKGRLELARNAAGEAAKLSDRAGNDPRMVTRAQLYQAVAEAPTVHVGDAMKTFAKLQRDQLSAADQQLLFAAEKLARSVGKEGVGLPDKAAVEEPPTETYLKRARDLVSATDAAIARAAK
jgi:chemotaxis protein MotC